MPDNHKAAVVQAVASSERARVISVDHRRGVCPYVDNRDARCAHRLTLINLSAAFRLCMGSYEACNVYHQIRLAELREPAELLVAESA